jgi:hypothetical protein
LFDFNFQALGIPPTECFTLAARLATSEELSPGKHIPVHLAKHWKAESLARATI